jgi:hypothetical protein
MKTGWEQIMNKIKNSRWAVATTALASLLISCASDSHDNAGQGSTEPQSGAASTSPTSGSDLASTQAQLRAAHASAGAAKSDAKSCFDKLGACKGDGGAIDQACLDQLQGCLPKAPPAPIGCPKIPDLTPEQVTQIDDAVGKADDLVGDAIDFASGAIDAVLDGGIAFPDGGFPFPIPVGSGGQGGRGGQPATHTKGRDPVGPGMIGDAGVPEAPQWPSFPQADAGAPTKPHGDAQIPTLPPIDPDASIGGGELCGVPLPVVPIGALKACADKAAADLKAGQDPIAVATDALTCIEAPFQDDIAKLCGDAKTECAKPGAPPNICGDVSDICSALSP